MNRLENESVEDQSMNQTPLDLEKLALEQRDFVEKELYKMECQQLNLEIDDMIEDKI